MSMNIGGPTRQVEKILSDLRAENARLQDGYDGLKYQYDEQHDELLRLRERVEQAERERDRALGELTASISEGHKWDEMYDKVIDERDRYKALAERRKKALGPFVALLQPHVEEAVYGGDAAPVFAINEAKITVGDLRRARAAITMKPEEAGR